MKLIPILEILRDEKGQSMVEYAIVTAVCVTALLGVLGIYLAALTGFYEEVLYLVGLPLP